MHLPILYSESQLEYSVRECVTRVGLTGDLPADLLVHPFERWNLSQSYEGVGLELCLFCDSMLFAVVVLFVLQVHFLSSSPTLHPSPRAHELYRA